MLSSGRVLWTVPFYSIVKDSEWRGTPHGAPLNFITIKSHIFWRSWWSQCSVRNNMEDTVLNKWKLKLCVLRPPLKQGFWRMASDCFSRTLGIWVKSTSSLLLKMDSVYISPIYSSFPGTRIKQGSLSYWLASSAKYSLLLWHVSWQYATVCPTLL